MVQANSRSFDCVNGLASESALSAQDDKSGKNHVGTAALGCLGEQGLAESGNR